MQEQDKPRQDIKPPSIFRLALEGRAPFEFGLSLLSAPLLRQAPAGDGHPVLVLPGLLAGDALTLLLRTNLKRLGYQAYAWEQGVNFGPRDGVLDACIARVRELHTRHARKVSLIGWSLGGIYAREIAKAVPQAVRSVITLGSPFTGHPTANNVWRVYEAVSGKKAVDATQSAELRKPPPVPTTSIFSRSDGIVSWQCCVADEGDQSENIEVHGSHTGLIANPTVLHAIADRLAQSEDQWRRFDRADGPLHSSVLGPFLYRVPRRA